MDLGLPRPVLPPGRLAGGYGGGMLATPPKVREVMSKIDSFLEQRRAQRVLRDAHRLCVVGLRF